jgi:hypothetical protein
MQIVFLSDYDFKKKSSSKKATRTMAAERKDGHVKRKAVNKK